jgi:two-component system LytT family sensor kinase
MKQKLLLYAIISTPIFAIYAVSHPLIFGVLPFKVLLKPLLGINITIFITWLTNIYLTLNFPQLSIWKKIFLSYASILGVQLILNVVRYFFLAGSNFFIPDEAIGFLDNNLVYPALTSSVINVIIIIICQATEASYRRNEAELKAKELELQNSEAQKKLLVQQLQPHFLFNALSVLKSLIGESPAQAEEYTVKLADFLRYSVQSHQNEVVTLADELRFVGDFVELQKVRFEDSFMYSVDVPDEVLKHNVPIFALQTLVENAFKHNYFTEHKPLIIKIFCSENAVVVWNNKMPVKTTDRTQTGLANLNSRYELITGKGIVINNGTDFFEVRIPLINA